MAAAVAGGGDGPGGFGGGGGLGSCAGVAVVLPRRHLFRESGPSARLCWWLGGAVLLRCPGGCSVRPATPEMSEFVLDLLVLIVCVLVVSSS